MKDHSDLGGMFDMTGVVRRDRAAAVQAGVIVDDVALRLETRAGVVHAGV